MTAPVEARSAPAAAPAQPLGLALVAASAVIWSTGGLIIRLVGAADDWTVIFWRSASACAFLLIFMALRDGRATVGLFRAMGLAGLAVGACFASASISLVVALRLTSVANTLLIMSAAPLVAALLGRVFLAEPVRPSTWLTIAAVAAGIAIMVSDAEGGGAMTGNLVALLIAVAYAGAIVITRRHHEVRMTPAACTGTAIAVAVSAPLAAPLSVGAGDLSLLVVFGAGQLGLGLAMFVSGARLVPAAATALIGTLEPILGPVWVWAFLAERPTGAALVGGGIVLASVVANTLVDLRRGRLVRTARPMA
jgi:drug/metabolite transporter (DMT)-like permease